MACWYSEKEARAARSYQRYARVTLAMAKDEGKYELFRKATNPCPKLGVGHMDASVLLRMDNECFELALECVRVRLMSGKAASGKLEDIRWHFYNSLEEMFSELRVETDRRKSDLKQLLDFRIMTSKVETSLRDMLISRTTNGRYEKGESGSAARRKAKIHKRQISNALTKALEKVLEAEDREGQEGSDEVVHVQKETVPAVERPVDVVTRGGTVAGEKKCPVLK